MVHVAEVVNASCRFPELFANEYATGEVSGKLDDTLRRMHNYYQEEGTRKLHAIAQWMPRGIYFLVALMIGYNVIRFYTAYFKPGRLPARTTVGVTHLARGGIVEIDMIAVRH